MPQIVGDVRKFAARAVRGMQISRGIAAWIDLPGKLNLSELRGVGVKVEELLISQPDTIEQAVEIAGTLLRTGNVELVVLDLGEGRFLPDGGARLDAVGRQVGCALLCV